ncbi:LIM domain kinase 1-like [Elysia marginata]|uniref:non-specific serine/threonine protein kinase n=1 Tax=Elysia marginata TaxID=1093978 RepID=A0AAV4J2P0_9GAST|nr:LIM domain kinase 1-like [Elysia marginata]
MVAGEHRFHPECFQCCLCQVIIGDGEPYALVERSFLYCGECYHKTTHKPSSQHHQQTASITSPQCGETPTQQGTEPPSSSSLSTLTPHDLDPNSKTTFAVAPPSSSETTATDRQASPLQPAITTTTAATVEDAAITTAATTLSSKLTFQQQTPRRKTHSIQMVSIRPSQKTPTKLVAKSIPLTTTPTAIAVTGNTNKSYSDIASPTDGISKPFRDKTTTSRDDLKKQQQQRQQRRNQHRQHQQQQQQQQEQLQQQLRDASAASAASSLNHEQKPSPQLDSGQGEGCDLSPNQVDGRDSFSQQGEPRDMFSQQDESPHTSSTLGAGHDLSSPQGEGYDLFTKERDLDVDGGKANMKRLQLTLRSLSSNGDGSQPGSWDIRRSLNRNSGAGGRSTPCVVIDQLWPGSELEGLEVGDRILEVNGASIKDKTLDEVRHMLTDNLSPVAVMLERDLSPLRLPKEEGEEPGSPSSASPVRTRLLRGGVKAEGAESDQSSDSNAETVVVHDTLVRLRPKNSLKAKGHSPNRRRSKSPSPCPSSRQKSIDLSRSHSFTTHSQQHRVFRATDLMLGEVLGQGFFGQAIKAVHRVTGEIMVLKELHNFDESAQKSFLREVSMLRNVSHPCVLRFMGVLYRDRKLNLVTEFIDGGALTDLLLNHSEELSWKQRVAFAKDIANGMNYLHSIDIIHRDLNSQNCLVRSDQTVVVADFGLAKICPRHERLDWLLSSGRKGGDSGEETLTTIGEGVTQTDAAAGSGGGRIPKGAMKKKRFSRRKRQTVVGNPYWMAPEMMTKGVYDEKVDVFSFGIIVCETIARVTADPDYLPRSLDFGLNVEAFHKRFCQDVPEPYFMLAVLCSQMEPDQRPSFEKIYMLCEALYLHVEHKMAVPVELQGSTVQFYRRYKMETYGTNFKDIDSCTEADSGTEKQKSTATSQMGVGVSDTQTKESSDGENQCDSQGEVTSPERITSERSQGQKLGSGDQGYPSSNPASDCDAEPSDTGSGSSQAVGMSGCATGNLPTNTDTLQEGTSQSGYAAVETPIAAPDRETTVAERCSQPSSRPSCLSVMTANDDQAYFSCPSASPPASPSSTCQFSSCQASPDPTNLSNCLRHSMDLNTSHKISLPDTTVVGQANEASLELSSSNRPKSVSPASDAVRNETPAHLYKLTSLSLNDVTPISHLLSVNSGTDQDRARQNGSAESGIFSDAAVSPKPAVRTSPVPVSPHLLTQTEKNDKKAQDSQV